ncbi:PREDICTED: uncharacterized protein LOC109475697, partial [Branchiostoma belcheri]|uniref:Uncharacterized protein LOC109475697 n=1 Tax=Branchiostoma belcheri TaxID=7741 RepID=A0A6P4ZLU2_BRABE
ARVNVASLARQTVTNDIASSGTTVTTDIQESALKDLKHANPKGRYWIKIDGTDIKPALQESMKGQWNGAIDLRDGKLAELRKECDQRLELVNNLEVNKERATLEEKIKTLVNTFHDDSHFLQQALTEADYNGHLPNTLYLQLDNSAKECKNKYIIAFATWLVHLRIFRKVKT